MKILLRSKEKTVYPTAWLLAFLYFLKDPAWTQNLNQYLNYNNRFYLALHCKSQSIVITTEQCTPHRLSLPSMC